MTFYFYDLETSGINPRAQRIMQFAGQRTDENFNPIGEPQNWLIKLTDEVLPDPDAVLITGVTPQKTLEEGYTEKEFLELFYKEVLQPDTVLLGFNTIRFDDEFMRATLWRNFYDPYEWQWQDGRSRWDLLDVVRMVRALRPEGIEWPFEERSIDGSDHGAQTTKTSTTKRVPTNRLELLTKANGLDHEHAHDALNDVLATISIAKLLKEKQPKIFDYLLNCRGKKQVQELISLIEPRPFVYCSGRYSNDFLKTTVVVPVAEAPNGGFLVYDLRQDPSELIKLSDEDFIKTAFFKNPESEILPLKVLKINCCPAVAPLGVLDEASQKRLDIDLKQIEINLSTLRAVKGFSEKAKNLFEKHQSERQKLYSKDTDPDLQIYDGFVGDEDKLKLRAVRAADESSLSDPALEFKDSRLSQLLPRYKARNFPKSLNTIERESWESYRSKRILKGINGQLSLEQFATRLAELSAVKSDDDNAQYLLQELQLYAESIAPLPEELADFES